MNPWLVPGLVLSTGAAAGGYLVLCRYTRRRSDHLVYSWSDRRRQILAEAAEQRGGRRPVRLTPGEVNHILFGLRSLATGMRASATHHDIRDPETAALSRERADEYEALIEWIEREVA